MAGFLSLLLTLAPVGTFATVGPVTTLFDNWNTAAVVSNVQVEPTVTITQSTLVTQIVDYHYNRGLGEPPGSIWFYDQSTYTVYGPYQATGSYGNTAWTVEPNIIVPPGSYRVIDHGAFWSCNNQSGLVGFSKVMGQAVSAPKVLFDNYNIYTVYNSPHALPTFTITQSTLVTQIINDHWNYGFGAVPNEMYIVGGAIAYGPYPATGSYGNTAWTAEPNVFLPPGTYMIEDGGFTTWSWNAATGGAGFSQVWGVAR